MKLITTIFIVLCLQTTHGKENIADVQSLITAMRNKYKDKWYKCLTFDQKTTFYKDGAKVKEETWLEAMEMPTGLIIKIDSFSSGRGMLFKNDSMYIFQNNQIVNQQPKVHELLVMGFSVYFDNPEITLQKLKQAEVDVTQFEENETHYIISGERKIYIEKKRLVFSHLISPNPDGSTTKIEFKQYEKLKGGWIAPEVNFYRNSQLMMKEEYYNVKVPKDLPDTIFDQKKFINTKW